MNERIDVLAVMDEMIDCYGSVEECQDDTEFLEAAREARAAVAELIEADREYDAARSAYAASVLPTVARANSQRIANASDRRRAALARVGGAE